MSLGGSIATPTPERVVSVLRGACRWLATGLIAGCSARPAPLPDAPRVSEAGCQVRVSAASRDPLELSVAADCPKLEPEAFVAEPGLGKYVVAARGDSGARGSIAGDRVELSEAAGGVRYWLDLEGMAREQADFNIALSVGRSVVAPGYSWLLAPSGIPDDTLVRLDLGQGLDATNFATGLMPDGSGFLLRANEISVATFSVFGKFERSEFQLPSVNGQPAQLNVVTLDGSLSVPKDVLQVWLQQTARAVSEFYGGFPVERTLVVVVPVKDADRVVHGKVLPESSPGIALLVGSQTGPTGLYADWILTHELFHLGFPSFVDEGKWLDEGLATYYEPLIRARQGWLEEAAVWQEFYQNMTRWLRVLEHDGLETPGSVRGMYWAGAVVCLLADIEAYRKTGGRRGLAAGLKALLRAGGDASRVWSLRDAVQHIDAALGAPILAQLTERYTRGAPVHLSERFAALGVVESNGHVRLDDAAPLANIRRAIMRGGS